MRDPYTVLGVSKSASQKEIKSAFHSLAKKYHPDQNKSDPKAQQRFAEANQAYEIVGDEKKRGQFNRGEIDATGKEKFTGFEQGGFDPGAFGFGKGRSRGPGGFGGSGPGAEDILSEIFGSAFGGAKQNTGQSHGFHTQGHQRQKRPDLDTKLKLLISVEDLARAKASVRLPDGKQISVSVPPEAQDGQVIRLKGQGLKQPGLAPGDMHITLSIKPHPEFKVTGANLRYILPLDLKTAVLGGKAQVSTIDGKIALTIPPRTSSGKTFRLKGKGLPKKGGGYGDLFVEAAIQLPKDGLKELGDFLANKVV